MLTVIFKDTEYCTYRDRVEIRGSVSALSAGEWRVHHNFVREGRYSERGWACTPLGKFFHLGGMYARKWPLQSL
jgi:hypothetical protein